MTDKNKDNINSPIDTQNSNHTSENTANEKDNEVKEQKYDPKQDSSPVELGPFGYAQESASYSSLTDVSDGVTHPRKKNKFIQSLRDILPWDYWVAAFCAAFCFACLPPIFTNPTVFAKLEFVQEINIPNFFGTMFLFFGVLVMISMLFKRLAHIPAALLITSTAFAASLSFSVTKSNAITTDGERIFFLLGLCFVLFILISWVTKNDKIGLHKVNLSSRVIWIAAIIGAVVFTFFVSYATISRYSAYLAHNFDFGIFAQMFEKMSTTGLPDTTVERNVLMSHFGVHFSPFYYVLLPFYMLCPRPETILFLQALFVAAGVFPVVLICKKLNVSKWITLAFIGIYLLFPSLANGCLYDFHENKFLTVLIMWLMYFIVAKNTPLTFVFALLTLSVKEDAAIYVIAIALFVIFTRKEILKGGLLLALAGAYFVFATSMVAYFGDGVMISRLGNYIPIGEEGFTAVAKTCLLNFGYFITQIFTAEKFPFLLWMFLPLAFSPFMGKNKSTLFLLVPMLVVDLMSNWPYQYDINFQYTFGVAALLIFMSILAASQMKPNARRTVTALSLSFCLVLSCALFIPRGSYYVEVGKNMQEISADYDKLIATIPKDKSMTADGKLIAHMYDFEDIYMYPDMHSSNYDESDKTDYFLVVESNVTSNSEGLATLMGDDYEKIDSTRDIALYRKK